MERADWPAPRAVGTINFILRTLIQKGGTAEYGEDAGRRHQQVTSTGSQGRLPGGGRVWAET